MEKGDMTSVKGKSSHRTVLMAYDATKEVTEHALNHAIADVFQTGDILQQGDTLVVFGILHRVINPMGYQTQASTSAFIGTNARALEEGVVKKIENYERMLQKVIVRCREQGVMLDVRITAGMPIKIVTLQVASKLNATWLILDRHLRKDWKFYMDQLHCKLALIQESHVEIIQESDQTENAESQLQKFFAKSQLEFSYFTKEKRIFPQDQESTLLSCKVSPSHHSNEQEGSDVHAFQHNTSTSILSSRSKSRTVGDVLQQYETTEVAESSPACREDNFSVASMEFRNTENKTSENLSDFQRSSSFRRFASLQNTWPKGPILCSICRQSSAICSRESKQFSFAEIEAATNNFSRENILGEGGFGYIYKGKLADGQLVAVKQHTEASKQGDAEFYSEVHFLSCAHHRNIVMLLGYCTEKEQSILVYEYICNKSLDWHLSDKNKNTLQWFERQAIAIGVAKGLRFLHEECRAGCIVHRDLKPSNILLTHDFNPMLGDFGLARRNTNDNHVTRVLGTLGYLAPEYVESGIVTEKTDVYSFGIVLLQLISGRKVVDFSKPYDQQSLIQWAEPLIRNLALHEFMDPRLGESYDTDELYKMVRTAFLCIQRDPSKRPPIGQVVRLLEGESEWIQEVVQCFLP